MFRFDISALPCRGQVRRSCADIKIVSNPTSLNAVYKPNPVQAAPKIQQTYECLVQYTGYPHYKPSKGVWWVRNNNTDPLLYTGDCLKCWILPLSNLTLQANQCETCRINCSLPGRVCPNECYCRW